MKTLIAVASDGWAIAKDDEGYWLLRPPFRQRDRMALTPAQVERAAFEEDFEPEPQPSEFAGWGELCRHLEEIAVANATDEERASEWQGAGQLLARANAEQARRHLAKMREILETGRSSRIETALIALLQSTAVQHDAVLVAEAGRLLSLAQQRRPRLRTPKTAQQDWPVADPEGAAQVAAAIRERRNLLVPAA